MRAAHNSERSDHGHGNESQGQAAYRHGAEARAIPTCTITPRARKSRPAHHASIARSTKTPRCTRWCAGSSAAASRRRTARRSCSPTSPTAKGRKYDIPVLVGGLAANREIYRIGVGCEFDEIDARWVQRRAASAAAARRRPTRRATTSSSPARRSTSRARASTASRCRSRRRAGTSRPTPRCRSTSPRTPTPACRTWATTAAR